ncbi:FAD-binding oxidoreductase [Rhodococcus sp. ACPA1]|uniref:FAD-binding oxidoreductase n=1 Tax=Rhodococcus sp. ACPA1 TaxID=2028572 RepID=UPI000BB0EC2B|nr:FAD-linked oxidase C-terminal domain-containing protein [Rhodococcus sp. ACPA1]PBC51558.1 FAD-binding oxidoreductase [Rhodococcus sp. ACPA1]
MTACKNEAPGTSSAQDDYSDLRSELPNSCTTTDEEILNSYERDQASWANSGRPAALVRPTTVAEIQQAVQVCYERSIPVVTRGAGTGLAGGANALDGCVIISTERMNRIVEINPLERLAVVEPGVVNNDLTHACAAEGLWYPPDPASAEWSTIGGNVATNAGGLCCVKYGVTRDYVLSLQVVTGTGDLVTLGRRTAKGVAGYDLVGLMTGSEGTLGVITEVTLRLRPQQQPQTTVVGYFSSMVDAANAVRAIAESGITPSALELMDQNCLKAIDRWRSMGLSDEAHTILLARTDAEGAAADAEAGEILSCFRTNGSTWAAQSTDQGEADALFSARRLAYPAVERLGNVLTEDVCVPKSQLPRMLDAVESIAAANDTLIATIAHAGDGNLHPLIVTTPGDTGQETRARRAFDQIMAVAIRLGGTITGEHGVGTLKAPGLEHELSTAVMAMHKKIKQALDPRSIMNPGKVLTP